MRWLILIPIIILIFSIGLGIGYFNGFNVIEERLNIMARDVITYEEIKEIADEIEEKWIFDINRYKQVYRFVMNNITYEKDNEVENWYMLNNTPLHTLEHGGDCESKAILALSILKAMGYDNTYMIYQPKHICWGIWDDTFNFYMFNCNENKTIVGVRRV